MEIKNNATKQGLFAGALGSIVYLPVMVILQPTVFAIAVFSILPDINKTAGEFFGWLIHVLILSITAAIFANLLKKNKDAWTLMTAGVGWSFITGFFIIFAAASLGLSLPPHGWLLEIAANTINGLVIGYVISYFRK